MSPDAPRTRLHPSRRLGALVAVFLATVPLGAAGDETRLLLCLAPGPGDVEAAATLDGWVNSASVELAPPPCPAPTGDDYVGRFELQDGSVYFRLVGSAGPTLARAVPWLTDVEAPLASLDAAGWIGEFSVVLEALLAEHHLTLEWAEILEAEVARAPAEPEVVVPKSLLGGAADARRRGNAEAAPGRARAGPAAPGPATRTAPAGGRAGAAGPAVVRAGATGDAARAAAVPGGGRGDDATRTADGSSSVAALPGDGGDAPPVAALPGDAGGGSPVAALPGDAGVGTSVTPLPGDAGGASPVAPLPGGAGGDTSVAALPGGAGGDTSVAALPGGASGDTSEVLSSDTSGEASVAMLPGDGGGDTRALAPLSGDGSSDIPSTAAPGDGARGGTSVAALPPDAMPAPDPIAPDHVGPESIAPEPEEPRLPGIEEVARAEAAAREARRNAIDFQAPDASAIALAVTAGGALRVRSPDIAAPEIALGFEIGTLYARGSWQPQVEWSLAGFTMGVEAFAAEAGLHFPLLSGRLWGLRGHAGVAVERLVLSPLYRQGASQAVDWDAGPTAGATLGWRPAANLVVGIAGGLQWMPTARLTHIGELGPSTRVNSVGGRLGFDFSWRR